MPLLQLCVLGFICYLVAGWVDIEVLTKTLSIPSVHAKVWCSAPQHGNKPATLADRVALQALWRKPLVDHFQVLLQILIDTIDAAAEVPEQFVQRTGIHSTANRVDIYAVALYLFAQLYIRQAQRADAMDVWPSSQPFGTSAAVTVSHRPLSIACKVHHML